MHRVGTPTPERNLKGKEVLHWWTLTWGSEQVEPQSGCPSPQEQHRGDKACWLLGELLGQIEGLEKPRIYSKECACAVSSTVMTKRDLHWQLSPHCTPQSEWGRHPVLLTPYHRLA